MKEQSLLVVEDDKDLAELVAMHLGNLGHPVTMVHDGREAQALLQRRHFDLVILDLNLPGVDGLEICRQLRQDSPYTAILMLTARTTELDRVLGLEVGADDYLTKPFSVRELVARAKAVLRRMDAFASTASSQHDSSPVVIGDLALSARERSVHVSGKPVELTAREFDLLEYFARNPGRVFTRAQLLDNVWGYSHEGYEHTVNTHINRLRAKIEEDPAHPRFILTVWGVGYKFARADELKEPT